MLTGEWTNIMRILYMGRKATGAQCLEWLLERGHSIEAVLTDSHLQGSPTAAVARANNLNMMTLEEARALIAAGELQFDLGLSVVYWRRISEDVISAAPLGIINFHPAPLPGFKGTAGYNVAILRGLSEWAVSAHYIDASIDTGPIIHVDNFPIDPDRETARSLESKSATRMAELLKRVVTQVERQERTLQTIPNEGGEYFSRDDMENMKLVKAGDDIERKIRAFWFPPYSGATIMIEGKPFTIVDQSILTEIAEAAPGTSLNSRSAVTE